ncbi:glycosyltransferase [Microbacterium sp.]|uniref:glycosyltransferase n=1 Tax=Microbacterium sp. TaxID=51671 RepID=UPI002B588CF6|nr:glycosyltransferase [Microbacterium sp.]HWK77244.1 glycosyltransferase [Microbacterium sp.]
MKVAVTKATLQVPPTYFAVQHAIALSDRFDFRFFASAANVTDDTVRERVSITDVSRSIPLLRGRHYSFRDKIAPLLDVPTSRAISRWTPDVIHQHFATLSGAAVRAHRRRQVPMLVTVHGADVYVPFTPLASRRGLSRALLAHHQRTVLRAFDEASTVLAVSEYLAGRVVEAGADPRKVEVHYQGIDTDMYTPAVRPESSDVPVVAFVGALSEAKGVRDLLAASLSIASRTPHRLVFAGDGPLRELLDRAALEHSHVEVLGSVTRDRIKQLLAGATALALPTQEWKGWREAAGLVTLEAQAMGVPVVVYDSGGAREMFQHASTGLLVTEGDVAELGGAIEQILTLPGAEHAAMGQRARAFVVENRSLATSAAQLADHYQEAVS